MTHSEALRVAQDASDARITSACNELEAVLGAVVRAPPEQISTYSTYTPSSRGGCPSRHSPHPRERGTSRPPPPCSGGAGASSPCARPRHRFQFSVLSGSRNDRRSDRRGGSSRGCGRTHADASSRSGRSARRASSSAASARHSCRATETASAWRRADVAMHDAGPRSFEPREDGPRSFGPDAWKQPCAPAAVTTWVQPNGILA